MSRAREGYQAHSVTAAVGVAHSGRATGGVLPLTYHYGGELADCPAVSFRFVYLHNK